jgi:DNA-binding protein Fis
LVEEGVSDNMPLMTLKEMEQKMIDLALKHTGGNRTQAARILGIDPRTLRAKLRELPTDEP